MSSPALGGLKRAIGELSEREKVSLATWINLSVIREELLAADRQISRGEGVEYDEVLPLLFAETEANAMQLLREPESGLFFHS
jgi:hypothetical protein